MVKNNENLSEKLNHLSVFGLPLNIYQVSWACLPFKKQSMSEFKQSGLSWTIWPQTVDDLRLALTLSLPHGHSENDQ